MLNWLNRKKYKHVLEGDIILLDDDVREPKKRFFGLKTIQVWKKSPYRVIEKREKSPSIYFIKVQNIQNNEIQKITVLSYWHAKMHSSNS